MISILKTLKTKLPSLFWSKKDRIIAFPVLLIILVLLFVYVFIVNGSTTTSKSYEQAEWYSDEYIHVDVDLLDSLATKKGFSGTQEFYGSPYHLVMYAIPDVDTEEEKFHQKDMDAFLEQESYKKISEAVVKDARLITMHDETILDLGDIDLMGGSEVILVGNAHHLDILFLNMFSKGERDSKYVKGRIDFGKFDLEYQPYMLEGTLTMETANGHIERYFHVTLFPEGVKSGFDSTTFAEIQLPIVFGTLPLMLMMVAFVALAMKLITQIKYSIAFKIQLIFYLIFFYSVETLAIWLPNERWDTILLLLILMILQVILYRKYSNRSYILIILGTILAPVIFYYGFNFIATLIFG